MTTSETPVPTTDASITVDDDVERRVAAFEATTSALIAERLAAAEVQLNALIAHQNAQHAEMNARVSALERQYGYTGPPVHGTWSRPYASRWRDGTTTTAEHREKQYGC